METTISPPLSRISKKRRSFSKSSVFLHKIRLKSAGFLYGAAISLNKALFRFADQTKTLDRELNRAENAAKVIVNGRQIFKL